MKALYDVTLAGDDEPVPMAERPEMRELLAESDPRAKVAGYARLARQVSERVGVVVAALGAAGTEAGGEAAELVERTGRSGSRGHGVRAAPRVGRDARGRDVDPVAAAESCWVLISPEVYRLCVTVRGWTGDAYETWLTRMLTATVLGR